MSYELRVSGASRVARRGYRTAESARGRGFGVLSDGAWAPNAEPEGSAVLASNGRAVDAIVRQLNLQLTSDFGAEQWRVGHSRGARRENRAQRRDERR